MGIGSGVVIEAAKYVAKAASAPLVQASFAAGYPWYTVINHTNQRGPMLGPDSEDSGPQRSSCSAWAPDEIERCVDTGLRLCRKPQTREDQPFLPSRLICRAALVLSLAAARRQVTARGRLPAPGCLPRSTRPDCRANLPGQQDRSAMPPRWRGPFEPVRHARRCCRPGQ